MTIVVPIDFSEESLIGIELASLFARKMNAKLVLVHVLTSVNLSGSAYASFSEAEQEFGKIIERFKNIDPDLNIEYIIKEGKIQTEVCNQAESYDKSMIVLSTHGKSGFKELLLGSNAYKIITISKKPVITIRQKVSFQHINRIVIPIDITFQSRENVPFTSRIAKIFGAEIFLVTVRTTNEKRVEKKLLQYSKQVSSYLKNRDIPLKVEHLHGNNITDITRDYADSVKAELISIMAEQEVGISNLFSGSYTHQMINSAHIPVLVYPNYPIEVPTEDLRTQGVYYE